MTYPEPRYFADEGEVSGAFRPASAAPEIDRGDGSGVHYLGTGDKTDGQFGLYRWDMSAKPAGPAPHFHKTISESFFILSGTIRLYDGENTVEAEQGDFLYVPPGGIHSFRNESGEPASMLILFTPGAPREAYFEETAEIARTGRQLTPEEWTELYLRHDQYMV